MQTTSNSDENSFLRRLFRGHQETLMSQLAAHRRAIDHPTLKGDVTEGEWVALLDKHLPKRYRVSRGHVVDSDGSVSLQVDAIVHDAQYCPVFESTHNVCFVPSESVYAVFEVKQTVNLKYLKEAAEKAESVRKLHRTSGGIIDRGVQREARPLPPILAGILAGDVEWADGFGKSFINAMQGYSGNQSLNLGCAPKSGYFELPFDGGTDDLICHSSDLAFARFFIRLTHRLQKLGTVPAIDWEKYSASFGL